MYVDGVFYARPAAATLDFLDVERIEVLRGPQGTLFGKNTTAGAINVTTRRPSFTPAAEAEINYGSFAFVQARGSITGPLSRTIAARASFSSTQRSGVVGNTATGRAVNDLSNLGARGQVLFTPRDRRRADPGRRSHPPAARGFHAGGRRRRADLASREPAVPEDRGRSRLHAPQLQRLRSAHRRRHPAALAPGPGRRRDHARLEARSRPADLDDGLAVLGLEPVKRSRLHRPASDDGVGGAVASSGNGRRRCATPAIWRGT